MILQMNWKIRHKQLQILIPALNRDLGPNLMILRPSTPSHFGSQSPPESLQSKNLPNQNLPAEFFSWAKS
jgi:hypothetical protein